MIRRAAGSAIALVMLVPCLSLAAKSAPDHGPRTGLVVASNINLVPTQFESAVTLIEAMTRLQQLGPINACCGGAWRVHFAVQLERPSDFVAGHEYEVLVQRPSGIGRRALAKGRFTLGE